MGLSMEVTDMDAKLIHSEQSPKEGNKNLHKRRNYYSREALRASKLTGKSNSRQPALIFLTRRLLYRFVRLYFWAQLCREPQALLTSRTDRVSESVEVERVNEQVHHGAQPVTEGDIQTVSDVLEVLHIYIEAFANKESLGFQNIAIIKDLLVKMRYFVLQRQENDALLFEIDNYTGSFIELLYTSNPNARKFLVYYLNLWKFSVLRRIASHFENSALRQMYSHAKTARDFAPEFSCWQILTQKLKKELTETRRCPTFRFSKAELLEARALSSRAILEDVHAPDPLTQQLFLYSSFSADAFSDILSHMKSLTLRESRLFVQAKIASEDEFVGVPNIMALEARITALHCRLLHLVYKGKLHFSIRAHLGFDMNFDSDEGISLSQDVSARRHSPVSRTRAVSDVFGKVAERSKAPCLGRGPKGRGFESHPCQIVFFFRDDPQSFCVGIAGRACSYISFLEYISLDQRELQKKSIVSPCLLEFLTEDTKHAALQSLTAGRVDHPGSWFLVLLLLRHDRAHRSIECMRRLGSAILNQQFSPLRSSDTQPELSSFLIILAFGLSMEWQDYRKLFVLLQRLCRRKKRCLTNELKTLRKPISNEEKALKTFITNYIIEIQAQLKFKGTSGENLMMSGTSDYNFQQLWLLLTGPMCHKGQASELLYTSVRYGMHSIAINCDGGGAA